jgi:hypothetical protein
MTGRNIELFFGGDTLSRHPAKALAVLIFQEK